MLVSAKEVIEFHDRLIARDIGVEGMPDAGRSEVIIQRVLNMHHYQWDNGTASNLMQFRIVLTLGPLDYFTMSGRHVLFLM